MPMRIVSPLVRYGKRPDSATPCGVPVLTMSPVEHKILRQMPDQVRHREDHVGGGGVLPRLAVHRGPQPQRLHIGNLVGWNQVGAKGIEGLAAFALGPLAARLLDLICPLGHVVADRVAGHVVQRVGRGSQIPRPVADHDGELDLPVDLRRARRDADVVVRADDRVGVFEEQHRHFRWCVTGFGGVRGIVLPDTQHGARFGYRCADP
jgi:hypothetical protein